MPLGQSGPPPSVLRQGWAVTGNMACDMCMRPREVTPPVPQGRETYVLSIKDRRGAGCRAPPCCQCCLGGHRDPGCADLQWQGSGCSPMWCWVGYPWSSPANHGGVQSRGPHWLHLCLWAERRVNQKHMVGAGHSDRITHATTETGLSCNAARLRRRHNSLHQNALATPSHTHAR